MKSSSSLKYTICQNLHIEADDLNRPISLEEIKSIINKLQKKAPDSMSSMQNSTNIQGRNYTNFLQSLSENGSRVNISELFYEFQQYYHKYQNQEKILGEKLQNSISHKHRCKYPPQQNTSKLNQRQDKRNYTQ